MIEKIDYNELTPIAVISSPVQHKSIPLWEMQMSAGAVCTTLLYAVQSLDYAAQWLTEWYAYNDNLLKILGGEIGKDQIADLFTGQKSAHWWNALAGI